MTVRIRIRVKELPVKQIGINTPFIRLDALLKLADMVQSGGHAKLVIQGGEVKVNGDVCELRGKKLRPGDRAQFNGMILEVVADTNA